MKPGTQADLVKEFGVSRNAISLLVKNKDYRIIYTPSGKIDLDATIKALRDSNFGERSRKMKAKNGSKPGKAKPQEPPTQEEHKEDLENEGPLKPSDTRERIERHKAFHAAEKDRIANAKTQKELVNFNQTSDTVFNFFRSLRDDILEIGKRVGGISNMAGSKHEATKIISDECNRVLVSMAGESYNFDDELKKKIIAILKQ